MYENYCIYIYVHRIERYLPTTNIFLDVLMCCCPLTNLGNLELLEEQVEERVAAAHQRQLDDGEVREEIVL